MTIENGIKESKPINIDNLLNKPMQLQGAMIQYQYSGPLPPPEALAKYNAIRPGTADEIIKWSKNQHDHRIQLENKRLDSEIQDQKSKNLEAKLGQILAFIICISAIISAFILGITDHPIASSFASIGSLTPLAAAFINGKNRKKNN